MINKNAPKNKGPEAVSKQAKIYIVDDHPIFREGLAGIINQQPNLTVCGQADNASTAFSEIPHAKPDVVITDITLNGKSGLELLKDLHSVQPSLPVLVISMHDEVLYAERVLRAGGRGYIMKQEGPENIVKAIAKVLSGHVYLSGAMAAAFLDQISQTKPKGKTSEIEKLTDREFEVVRHIGQGKTSHDVARDLHLSIKTVHAHCANIRQKLGLKTGHALIHFASRWVSSNG